MASNVMCEIRAVIRRCLPIGRRSTDEAVGEWATSRTIRASDHPARPSLAPCPGLGGRYRCRMAEALRLTAILEPRGPAGAFLLTDEQVAALGEGKRAFPVQVEVNGVALALRLARMGGENMIGLARAARERAGLDIGSAYDIVITGDIGVRSVEVPEDLAAALAADPTAHGAFTALAYSHRKEFVRWVTEAKKESTRAGRVAKTVDMVRGGLTR
jgi:hypothetical protein